MGFTVEFNENKFKDAIKTGNCNPPDVFAPFIAVDWRRYEKLRAISSPLNIEGIRSRVSTNMFSNIRGAMGFTLRYARNFFPAYLFFTNEFLNDEWLATVDWHKFHRDHVIHQPMSVYVGLSLLKGIDLSGNCSDSGKCQDPIKFDKDCLLDQCVTAIEESPKCAYLREYLQQMGGSNYYFDNTPRSKELWKTLFLDTFFLAALFHDIGYPWQFVNIVQNALHPHNPFENPIGQNAEWIERNYGNRLFLYPLNGYKPLDQTVPPHWNDERVQIVKQSLYETHGISGALAFIYLNDILRNPLQSAKPERRFCIEWAAMAIMMHDMVKLYSKKVDKKKRHGKFEYDVINPQLRLSIDRDPLSFILTLTDQIQDFGRPDSRFRPVQDNLEVRSASDKLEFSPIQDNRDKSIATYYSTCKNVTLNFDDTKTLTITYSYEDPGAYIKNREEYLPDNSIKYFDPFSGYMDLRGVGISKIILASELVRKENREDKNNIDPKQKTLNSFL